MNVFADLHHSGLYASLHYLFENRLGFELFRPIGTRWFDEGYWKIAQPYNNNPATIEQYLGIRQDFLPPDGTPALNTIKEQKDGVYYIHDGAHNYYQKAITFEKFLEMDIDVVIASIPAHVEAYKKLIEKHKPKAKLIYQMGNIGWHEHVPFNEVKNIMASVKEFSVPSDVNAVFYRQEFDTEVFKPSPLTTKWITSFVNCLPDPERFNRLREMLPDWEFRAFGISCPDGIWTNIEDIALYMKTSMWGYHYKPGGDGYGHVIHNWMAVGRPVLVNLRDYKDKLAGELLEDGVTCFDISDMDAAEIAYRLEQPNHINIPEYDQMVENVKQRFAQVVDFKRDAEKVKEFIGRLR